MSWKTKTKKSLNDDEEPEIHQEQYSPLTASEEIGPLVVIIFVVVIAIRPVGGLAHLVRLGKDFVPFRIVEVDDAAHVSLSACCPLVVIEGYICNLLLIRGHEISGMVQLQADILNLF